MLRSAECVEKPKEVVEVNVIVGVVLRAFALRRNGSEIGTGEAVKKDRNAEQIRIAVAIRIATGRVACAVAEASPDASGVCCSVALFGLLIHDVVTTERTASAVTQAEPRTGRVIDTVTLLGPRLNVVAAEPALAIAEAKARTSGIVGTIALFRKVIIQVVAADGRAGTSANSAGFEERNAVLGVALVFR